MRARTITVMIAMGLLTACVPTRQDYDTYVTLLQGSSRARNEAIKDCANGFDANARRIFGLLTDASDKNAPRVACSRFVNAVISGRATYDDIVDIKRHRPSPKLIKILQGR
ncbi:hypothetical protein ATY75_27425 [Rhizobium sp. N122]|uniref:hypothetical protein n=1 Tax=Rhizobium sp. N122 TaxID=1764272 RepID=UPI000B5A8C0B|nr:hypothetical protein [Rhizobium sp. N122]OWV82554.1 hypothetical protein ATY75_27425 [Rhizobium sp. N122]